MKLCSMKFAQFDHMQSSSVLALRSRAVAPHIIYVFYVDTGWQQFKNIKYVLRDIKDVIFFECHFLLQLILQNVPYTQVHGFWMGHGFTRAHQGRKNAGFCCVGDWLWMEKVNKIIQDVPFLFSCKCTTKRRLDPSRIVGSFTLATCVNPIFRVTISWNESTILNH